MGTWRRLREAGWAWLAGPAWYAVGAFSVLPEGAVSGAGTWVSLVLGAFLGGSWSRHAGRDHCLSRVVASLVSQ